MRETTNTIVVEHYGKETKKWISETELQKILVEHKLWLEGRGGKRADLSGASLRGANLNEVNLSEADLSKADLYEANLYRADFERTDLSGANLYEANLKEANLRRANLSMANLVGANLRRANLSEADLGRTDLSGASLYEAILYEASLCEASLYRTNLSVANLVGANLHGASFKWATFYGANLYRANFSEANLYGANLYEVDLRGAENIPYIPLVCPESGAFIGYKKARDNLIVKLEIPADAKRSSATTRKCRCNKAEVLEIQTLEGDTAEENKAVSLYDPRFVYKVGEIVEVKNFDENRWDECSNGIHFFVNRQDAVEYY